MRRSSLLLAVPALLLVVAACGSGDDDTAGTVAPVTTSGAPIEPSDPPDAVDPTVTVRDGARPTAHGIGRAEPDSVRALLHRPGRSGAGATSSGPSPTSSRGGCGGRRDHRRGDGERHVARHPASAARSRACSTCRSVTDGVRIVLEADGQRYEYHAAGRRPVFFCRDAGAARRRVQGPHRWTAAGGRVERSAGGCRYVR